MKKFFTFIVALVATVNAMADSTQTSYDFLGTSNITVSSANITQRYDVATFGINTSTYALYITIPEMTYGNMVIPSFTISGITGQYTPNYGITFTSDQSFTVENVTEGKNVTGKITSGFISEDAQSFTLRISDMKYGNMPFGMTYSFDGSYVLYAKKYTKTDKIDVNIGNQYSYSADNVTYTVCKYKKDGYMEAIDVIVPEYTLKNTLMGDLTLGSYTVVGLHENGAYDGYYRNYADDGLKMHFKAVKEGETTMDADYALSTADNENIVVKLDDNGIESIVNNFKPGNMPFVITSTFPGESTAINTVKTTDDGQQTTNSARKVLIDGRIVISKNGTQYNLNGARIK